MLICLLLLLLAASFCVSRDFLRSLLMLFSVIPTAEGRLDSIHHTFWLASLPRAASPRNVVESHPSVLHAVQVVVVVMLDLVLVLP